jgi:DNA/RNA-binding domain of Phe-tRNA-synthetase-like protein
LSLGFQHDVNAPIVSRFLYQGLKVDFMPTDPSFGEALLGHVEQQNALERVKKIMDLLKRLV